MEQNESPADMSEIRSALTKHLREAEAASGIGPFVLELSSRDLAYGPPVAALFGFSTEKAPASFEELLKTVFVDDVPKILQALDGAQNSGTFYVEFRIKSLEGPFHWLAGKGQVAAGGDGSETLRGTFYDINERKQLEARLLSTNETLETRVAELREEARALEVLN